MLSEEAVFFPAVTFHGNLGDNFFGGGGGHFYNLFPLHLTGTNS